MESNGQAGLEPRRTWAERVGEVQAYYTQARRGGTCRECGKGGYLRIGKHPMAAQGWVGQPPKVCKTDLLMLKDWIEKAGWVCPGCAGRATATTTGGRVPYPEEMRGLWEQSENRDSYVAAGLLVGPEMWEYMTEKEQRELWEDRGRRVESPGYRQPTWEELKNKG